MSFEKINYYKSQKYPLLIPSPFVPSYYFLTQLPIYIYLISLRKSVHRTYAQRKDKSMIPIPLIRPLVLTDEMSRYDVITSE